MLFLLNYFPLILLDLSVLIDWGFGGLLIYRDESDFKFSILLLLLLPIKEIILSVFDLLVYALIVS